MEAFPFTAAEWESVEDVAAAILNAALANDDVLRASLRLQILDAFAELRARHGDHPLLLELVADYTDGDDGARAALYRRAVELAESHKLPTLGARLSLAPVLVELGDPVGALEELRACGGEAAGGDEVERGRWARALEMVAYDAADDGGRGKLYERAVEIARTHGQSALLLRLSHARFLLNTGDPASARVQLRLCRAELPEGDQDEREWWQELSNVAGLVEAGGTLE